MECSSPPINWRDHIRWRPYKGKHILYVDYGGCSPEQMIAVAEAVARIAAASPVKLLVLYNISGSHPTPAYTARSQQLARQVLAGKISKGAIVGLGRLRRLMRTICNHLDAHMPFQMFTTEQEALDWLVR